MIVFSGLIAENSVGGQEGDSFVAPRGVATNDGVRCPTQSYVRMDRGDESLKGDHCRMYHRFLSSTKFLQVECEEISGQAARDNGEGKTTATSFAARMFEARESAADLALGLEEKVFSPFFALYSGSPRVKSTL